MSNEKYHMTNLNKGINIAIITAIISGFSVFLNKFAVDFWKNSSVFTSAKNIFVALMLSVIVLGFNRANLLKLNKKDWYKLAFLGLLGGSIPFLLFFKGLTLIPAVNAAFIQKTLFVWVAILAFSLLKEKIGRAQLMALGVMLLSVVLLGIPAKIQFGYGEFLVLIAALMWSVETLYVQKLMKNISAMTAAWARMFFGSIFLMGYLATQGTVSQIIPTSSAQLFWIAVSSVFLFAYITTFYSAIKYASATYATSVLVIATPITIILNYTFTSGKLPAGFLFALVFAVSGVVILKANRYFTSLSPALLEEVATD
ncbi:MAG: DMT family transporter [bacterium]|nr:DMT family transporter [bacterium]